MAERQYRVPAATIVHPVNKFDLDGGSIRIENGIHVLENIVVGEGKKFEYKNNGEPIEIRGTFKAGKRSTVSINNGNGEIIGVAKLMCGMSEVTLLIGESSNDPRLLAIVSQMHERMKAQPRVQKKKEYVSSSSSDEDDGEDREWTESQDEESSSEEDEENCDAGKRKRLKIKPRQSNKRGKTE